jgi:single-strand DNA-binding protein
MANFNKVILAGNLTRDPQLSVLPSGSNVVEFGMAVNRKWKAPSGEMKEEVCFVDIRAYGRQAETLNQYTSKGKPLMIEGRLKLDQWESKEGQKRSKLYVILENFQFLGAPSEGGARGGRSARPADAGRSSGSMSEESPPLEDVAPAGDEIPF